MEKQEAENRFSVSKNLKQPVTFVRGGVWTVPGLG
jgi:hypothetical protein